MPLKVYNTLSGKKEDFTPLDNDTVRIYLCGLTVYDNFHIGHARSAINFDAIRRYLEYKGYKVKFVYNFTDVDDKIIERANREGVHYLELAKKYIASFHGEAAKLGLRKADYYPRATEHVGDIIELVESLISKGLAYKAGDSVFYSVRAFKDYGKLSKRSVDDMISGARVDPGEGKRDPLDFVLWKGAKPGEPSWDSPQGSGRPGWHVECSAMSVKYLGQPFDMHGGGADLIFPHHENEIAQSEGASGGMYAKFWMHNGMLRLDREKMSKSLGNIISVKEFLEKHSPDVLRHFVLSKQYRSPIDYSDQVIAESEGAIRRFRNALFNIDAASKEADPGTQMDEGDLLPEEFELYRMAKEAIPKFEEAMDDDFNTALAIGLVFELARKANVVSQSSLSNSGRKVLSSAGETISKLLEVMGFQVGMGAVEVGADIGRILGILIDVRSRLREKGDWELADDIRDRLLELGIVLEDRPDGTVWRLEE